MSSLAKRSEAQAMGFCGEKIRGMEAKKEIKVRLYTRAAEQSLSPLAACASPSLAPPATPKRAKHNTGMSSRVTTHVLSGTHVPPSLPRASSSIGSSFTGNSTACMAAHAPRRITSIRLFHPLAPSPRRSSSGSCAHTSMTRRRQYRTSQHRQRL